MSLIAVPMAKVNILLRILICSFAKQRRGKLTTSVCEIGSLKLIAYLANITTIIVCCKYSMNL